LGIACLLWLEHQLVRRHGVDAVMRSFNANLWIGLVMLLAIALDLLV
jgi:4-hydroxybenzoate polyprenyltransferase